VIFPSLRRAVLQPRGASSLFNNFNPEQEHGND